MINEIKNITQEDLYKMINEDGNNEIKDWLAKLGKERIDEIFDPEIMQRKQALREYDRNLPI